MTNNDFFVYDGNSKKELISQLSQYLNISYSTASTITLLLHFIMKARTRINPAEKYDQRCIAKPGVHYMYLPFHYYLSISRASLQIIVKFVDYFAFGIPSLILSGANILAPFIWTITDDIYCIVDEIKLAAKNKESITIEQLNKTMSERKDCINHSDEWKCPFCHSDCCQITSKQVTNIVSALLLSQLLVVDSNGFLKIPF